MIEVEVKARSFPGIEDKILDLGGELIGVETHIDLYLNSPFCDFTRTDEALRIRIKEEGTRLTYKGPKLDSETKSRREQTVRVDDPEALESILESVGFSRKYALGEATLAVDDVEGLGTFIEVELSGGEDWEAQKRTALDILARLGLRESIRKSYLELLNDAEGR